MAFIDRHVFYQGRYLGVELFTIRVCRFRPAAVHDARGTGPTFSRSHSPPAAGSPGWKKLKRPSGSARGSWDLSSAASHPSIPPYIFRCFKIGLRPGITPAWATWRKPVRCPRARIRPYCFPAPARSSRWPPPTLRRRPPDSSPLEGTVAAYALGDDYHEVLRARLRMLCEDIDRLAGRPMQSRGYVDTAPLLEREIASRAGLGWIGRNSMLIHPGLGSFLFLAEVLTGLNHPVRSAVSGGPLRNLRPLPAGLPDRMRPPGPDDRFGALHFLPHHRASRTDPRNPSAG